MYIWSSLVYDKLTTPWLENYILSQTKHRGLCFERVSRSCSTCCCLSHSGMSNSRKKCEIVFASSNSWYLKDNKLAIILITSQQVYIVFLIKFWNANIDKKPLLISILVYVSLTFSDQIEQKWSTVISPEKRKSNDSNDNETVF